MCFSAEASLAAGTLLIPCGSYCAAVAVKKAPRLLPLAIVPIFFGVQQVLEGLVWIALHEHRAELLLIASRGFLLFAMAVWPFWFFVTGAVAAPSRARRRGLAIAGVAASAWFWVIYLPVAVSTDWPVRIVQHSIQYDYYSVGLFQYVSPFLVRLLYLGCVVVPIALQSQEIDWQKGAVVVGSALVAAVMYQYAFISVWCFFAAILSASLVWEFHRVAHGQSPRPAPAGLLLAPTTRGMPPH